MYERFKPMNENYYEQVFGVRTVDRLPRGHIEASLCRKETLTSRPPGFHSIVRMEATNRFRVNLKRNVRWKSRLAFLKPSPPYQEALDHV